MFTRCLSCDSFLAVYRPGTRLLERHCFRCNTLMPAFNAKRNRLIEDELGYRVRQFADISRGVVDFMRTAMPHADRMPRQVKTCLQFYAIRGLRTAWHIWTPRVPDISFSVLSGALIRECDRYREQFSHVGIVAKDYARCAFTLEDLETHEMPRQFATA